MPRSVERADRSSPSVLASTHPDGHCEHQLRALRRGWRGGRGAREGRAAGGRAGSRAGRAPVPPEFTSAVADDAGEQFLLRAQAIVDQFDEAKTALVDAHARAARAAVGDRAFVLRSPPRGACRRDIYAALSADRNGTALQRRLGRSEHHAHRSRRPHWRAGRQRPHRHAAGQAGVWAAQAPCTCSPRPDGPAGRPAETQLPHGALGRAYASRLVDLRRCGRRQLS